MTADVAVVTGAARGIGLEISRMLVAEGLKVIRLDRNWDAESEEALPGPVESIDVSSYEDVKQTMARIEANHGSVAVLVNNAGIIRDAFCHKMEPEDFGSVISVNLVGPFNTCRLALPRMRARGFGRIVNISSMNALKGQIGQANYAAAKAGLIGLTKSIALENASKGITANCVAPGFIMTDMTASMPEAEQREQIARIPAGRAGFPRDVAEAVVWLASERSSFVTGQVLSVNGGQLTV